MHIKKLSLIICVLLDLSLLYMPLPPNNLLPTFTTRQSHYWSQLRAPFRLSFVSIKFLIGRVSKRVFLDNFRDFHGEIEAIRQECSFRSNQQVQYLVDYNAVIARHLGNDHPDFLRYKSLTRWSACFFVAALVGVVVGLGAYAEYSAKAKMSKEAAAQHKARA